jgi:hypothetical protein
VLKRVAIKQGKGAKGVWYCSRGIARLLYIYASEHMYICLTFEYTRTGSLGCQFNCLLCILCSSFFSRQNKELKPCKEANPAAPYPAKPEAAGARPYLFMTLS